MTARDQIAQLIEDLSQRELRQVIEYCVDHLNNPTEYRALADYLRLQNVLHPRRSHE